MPEARTRTQFMYWTNLIASFIEICQKYNIAVKSQKNVVVGFIEVDIELIEASWRKLGLREADHHVQRIALQ